MGRGGGDLNPWQRLNILRTKLETLKYRLRLRVIDLQQVFNKMLRMLGASGGRRYTLISEKFFKPKLKLIDGKVHSVS